jgi:hypothetical protein
MKPPTTPSAQLALDTVHQIPTEGIPSSVLNVMNHEHIERLAGVAPGTYKQDPYATYHKMQLALGTCQIEQYIPDNPLSMGSHGFEAEAHSATQGITEIWCDDMLIDSPEAVVEHLEKFEFPSLEMHIKNFDEAQRTRDIIEGEAKAQEHLGPTILKTGYALFFFPIFSYNEYGYENYFSAYALYPEVIERHFKLQADACLLNNLAAAKAYIEADLPPMHLLDFDMADSRGTLVDVRSLDRIWFPHFARCIEPGVKAGVKFLWHCDGNLMQMVPRLIEVGVKGFQGFQYECGMDYASICKMKAKDGSSLMIQAGVSVTRTLPYGTPKDVKDQLDWLVANGPTTGLFLGESSSMVPGVPWENLETLAKGLRYYRENGR